MNKNLKVFIIDLDGVVFQGNNLIPFADKAIQKLKSKGKIPLFLTNNSTTSSIHLAQKLLSMGIECSHSEIMTSGIAAAEFIKTTKVDNEMGIFVCGTNDLRSELTKLDIKISSPDTCGALLVGQNPNFTYDDLKHSVWALQRKIPFIACNMDPNFPSENGRLMPGCGSLVSAISTASKCIVNYEIGKPNPRILDLLLSKHRLNKKDCIIIGDNKNSDIELALQVNIPSVFINSNPSQIISKDYFEAKSLFEAVELLL
ncbi:HAD-IIA family hydrolase [Fluviispira multicolorata]|uniref:HAD-IIA family hydrolase n=1 Tax=Fluviispira multicolorata TaxID=2654512 RepID=A0A833JBF8_9BACT|nr:HAD-IIA family hydrolase [Fluviispira multicolorata]KAB8028040.1 HAD-IIA family hydrolase [Fluviispira multicolorata]